MARKLCPFSKAYSAHFHILAQYNSVYPKNKLGLLNWSYLFILGTKNCTLQLNMGPRQYRNYKHANDEQ